MARKNHPFALFCSFSAFVLVLRCLKAHVHKELYDILGSVGKKHRDPVEFVHVIGGIDTVRSSKGAEHLDCSVTIDVRQKKAKRYRKSD